MVNEGQHHLEVSHKGVPCETSQDGGRHLGRSHSAHSSLLSSKEDGMTLQQICKAHSPPTTSSCFSGFGTSLQRCLVQIWLLTLADGMSTGRKDQYNYPKPHGSLIHTYFPMAWDCVIRKCFPFHGECLYVQKGSKSHGIHNAFVVNPEI